MEILPLGISNSFEITPKIHSDSRGDFWESYRYDYLSEFVGHSLSLQQGNASVSRKGVLRGIHFAELNPGQGKYVTCLQGEILDFVVDIRIGSPTFGKWEKVVLNHQKRNSVYLAEGLGHAFIALTPDAIVNYMVTSTYNPQKEHAINPLDPEIGLEVPHGLEVLLSEKDIAAPSLSEAALSGLLPTIEQAQERYRELDSLQGVGQ